MKNYKKNLKLLKKNHVYSSEMEHDACGVGVIVSTEGKKSRKGKSKKNRRKSKRRR